MPKRAVKETSRLYAPSLLAALIIPACFILFIERTIHAAPENDGSTPSSIVAAIPADFPPTYFLDSTSGKPAGFAVDVMNELGRRAGMTVEYAYGKPWDGLIEMVNTHQADVIPSLTIAPERMEFVAFTEPVELVPVSLIVSADSTITTITPKLTIGAIRGSIPEKYLQKNYPSVKIELFDDLSRVLFQLLAGHIDAAFVLTPNIMKLARDAGVDEKIKAISPPVYEAKRGIALRKDDTELLDRLNREIHEFVGSPEYQNIYVKWYGKPTPYWTPVKMAGVGALLLVASIVGMAVWRYLSLVSLNNKLNRNITALTRAEKTIKNQIVELETKNAELERFTYTVSHDLKSPIITIKGFLGMLVADAETGNYERMKSDVSRIGNAADKMQSLLDGLLKLSRVGRVMNPPEEVSMAELAHDALELLHGSIRTEGIDIHIDPAMPPAFADRLRVREVLQNLIENAIKYMGDQTAPRIDIGYRAGPEGTIYFVKDNGMGIDPKFYQKIFGLFDKLNPASGGTGIGLALVKRIIDQHGGAIWVESEGAGKGACFCFTLPGVEKHEGRS